MSWYRDIDNSKDLKYSPPKVAEQKLDAGGNYVGEPGVDGALGATGGKGTLDDSVNGGG